MSIDDITIDIDFTRYIKKKTPEKVVLEIGMEKEILDKAMGELPEYMKRKGALTLHDKTDNAMNRFVDEYFCNGAKYTFEVRDGAYERRQELIITIEHPCAAMKRAESLFILFLGKYLKNSKV